MTELERLLEKAAAERAVAAFNLQAARQFFLRAAETERQAAALLGSADDRPDDPLGPPKEGQAS